MLFTFGVTFVVLGAVLTVASRAIFYNGMYSAAVRRWIAGESMSVALATLAGAGIVMVLLYFVGGGVPISGWCLPAWRSPSRWQASLESASFIGGWVGQRGSGLVAALNGRYRRPSNPAPPPRGPGAGTPPPPAQRPADTSTRPSATATRRAPDVAGDAAELPVPAGACGNRRPSPAGFFQFGALSRFASPAERLRRSVKTCGVGRMPRQAS